MKFQSKFFLLFSCFSAVLFAMTSCGGRKKEADATPSQAMLLQTPMPAVTEPIASAVPSPSPTVLPVPKSSDFVRIQEYVPQAVIALRYATADNFTGKVIYDFTDAYARYGTVVKLARAQELLEKQGYYIKVWDAYRPVSAQFRLWEICPDGNYVSNPNVGYSNHTRGCALDITLVDAAGNELEMPTGFDDFSAKADRDYSDVSETAAANARLLEDVMQSCGFQGYYREWWHFNDEERYEPELVFQPERR